MPRDPIIRLLFLSVDNLNDQNFMKDFAFSYRRGSRSIIVHDHYPDKLEDTRFVSKRISALLSEQMHHNNAFSGDQREILSEGAEGLVLRTQFIRFLQRSVPIFILNPIVSSAEGPKAGDINTVIDLLRNEFEFKEVVFFPKNRKSPLASGRELVESPEDYNRLLQVYEEEKNILDRALDHAPVRLASPNTLYRPKPEPS